MLYGGGFARAGGGPKGFGEPGKEHSTGKHLPGTSIMPSTHGCPAAATEHPQSWRCSRGIPPGLEASNILTDPETLPHAATTPPNRTPSQNAPASLQKSACT